MENEQAKDPRVVLAIDRTFLAWTRTSLATMALGFVVARLGVFLRELARTQGQGTVLDLAADTQSMHSIVIGTVFVVLGVVIQALALLEHRQLMRTFNAGALVLPLRWSLAQLVGMSLIVIGVGVAGYVVSLY